MSTKFTKKEIPMVESQSLQLTISSAQLNDTIARYLSQRLIEKGYKAITPSLLSFLSILECGVNYGSEIARSLGVSRQMVGKTVKELSRLGYLEQVEGDGRQKKILFTSDGERLISDARQLLFELDEALLSELGAKSVSSTIKKLDTIKSLIDKLACT